MTKPVRAILSVAIIFGALGALLFTTMRESAAYYKHVDEVMGTPEAWYGKSMNLHGFVVENSIMKRPDTLDYRFHVKNGDKVVLANYTGVVPDTFKDGAEVVLTGTLGPNGFHASEVMAKCPSKYDPDEKLSKAGQ
jgi:cytochrome c-type biogenesis protein CcmE